MYGTKKNNNQDILQQDINLILNLFNEKKFTEAKKIINQKIAKHQNSSILFNILGAIYAEQNEIDKAIDYYNKAIKKNPSYAQAYNNLGIAFHKLKKINESIQCYEKAIKFKNNFAEALNNLGNANRDINNFDEAQKNFDKAIQIKSDYAEAYYNKAAAYENLGNKKHALINYKKAIEIKPDYAEAYNDIGIIFSDEAKFDEALLNYNKSIKLKPNYEKAYNNLGNLLNNLGKYDEATKAYNKAIKIKPDYAKAYSNLLFNLNYIANLDQKISLSTAKKFRLNCKSTKKNFKTNYQYIKKPKKLRIGFVSADFGNHPGGYFTLNTIKELKNKNFELIAYSTTERTDEITEQFKSLFNEWNLIEKKSDEEIVKKIVNDGIHILFDVQGHSAKNRLPIFMYKPAPIQVSWLGQGTTGINEIDYFIGSKHITPEKEDKYYVEKVIRLPEISQSFSPPELDLNVTSLPALKNNFITFGSINKLSKINDDVINLWSEILLSIPNSKLILKNKNFDDKNIFDKIQTKFIKNKVNKNKLDFRGEAKTRLDLLKVYNEIDITLDPFPFQGNTSSCESVWMGVPVITLKGDRYLFHFGESINTNLSMENWIASNTKEYIDKAIKFSSNTDQLSKIRNNLRKNALKSPVFDSSRFTEHFNKMLWGFWHNFQKKE